MSVGEGKGPQEFRGLRAFLWPVHGHELKKLIPMLLIFFLISFDYNVLRTLKDTLIVTQKGSGAEVIPFLKLWMMLPGAFVMTFLFTRLANRYRLEKVFYIILGLFLFYFLAFALVLYPWRESLLLHGTADWLEGVLPAGAKGFVLMVRYWIFSTFYVMSELWSNIILSMLFWGFANQITKLGEAKRFYGLFGVGANLSGVASGLASMYLGSLSFHATVPYGSTAWEQSLLYLIGLIVAAGLLAIGLFRWMHKNIEDAEPLKVKQKKQLSVRGNFSYLFQSRYLMYIALIVISYNLIIHLVEVVWKDHVKLLYPASGDYNFYMNKITAITGLCATLTSLFISGNLIRHCGWTFTALLTPAILFVTSLCFFSCIFAKESLSELTLAFFGSTPLALAVFFGSTQNVMSRAAKYTVFDSTKEMAFVPLGEECKIRGKAVIDGVCSRVGKSGGSVIHQFLLLTFSTVSASTPYIAFFLFASITLWILATYKLGYKFNQLSENELISESNNDPELALAS
ncbi:MAG: NTP/NDP exchange transporter [Chlamydiia bacterium]|nr:NTP/NDP exchange transporter [Chlamydiia bacterium]